MSKQTTDAIARLKPTVFSQEDCNDVLRHLKSFQRRTVEFVFERMYGGDARRFLIADEVGLGKTMVARGIVAKSIRKLAEAEERRIDIIYICSNLAIASQNVARLNVLGDDGLELTSRLTLLPRTLGELQKNRINFVSFTPGTSFDLKSNVGRQEERSLLYHLLYQELDGVTEIQLLNFFQSPVKRWKRWRRRTRRMDNIDEGLAKKFLEEFRKNPELGESIEELCRTQYQSRDRNQRSGVRRQRNRIVGKLRRMLADVCVDTLEPDLIILDEFQRFRRILHGKEGEAQLARRLMDWGEARVLMLSATPYKMLTLRGEDEDHYEDFMETLKFLFGDDASVEIAELREQLRRRRIGFYGSDCSDMAAIREATTRVKDSLHSVMVRTERIDFTRDHNAMLQDEPVNAKLEAGDLEHARYLAQVADVMNSPDITEYWKSAPYLLNLMKGYRMKRDLREVLDSPSKRLIELLSAGDDHLLKKEMVEEWREIDPKNARLRALFDRVLDKQALWRRLWMPPSLPYVEPPEGVEKTRELTKSLIFSSWRVVPDSIATLLSYEVERRMVGQSVTPSKRYSAHAEMRGQRLQFSGQSMSVMALLYPSPTLAEKLDPLVLAREHGDGKPLPAGRMRDLAREVLEVAVDVPDSSDERGGKPDYDWYAACSARADVGAQAEVYDWICEPDGWLQAVRSDSHSQRDFREHLQRLSEVTRREHQLGKPPQNLTSTLVDIALGAPGPCALRALRRVAPELEYHSPILMSAAAQIAWGFRTLYNLSEVTDLLDGGQPYWKIVASYGVENDLQAVLDEYVHVLRDALGVQSKPAEERVTKIAKAVTKALSILPANLSVHELVVDEEARKVEIKDFTIRCRFALPFGDLRSDDTSEVQRKSKVRDAFNSPFRPFVVASTSVGQEGLDFHQYAHSVWHWNLPSNPVDLEQREGRVHRYKGHAIRKNLAAQYGLAATKTADPHITDPWEVLFQRADEEAELDGGLVPFWLYEPDVKGCSRVERRVPLLPLSREISRLDSLKRSLAVYRLAFGQARQEELVSYVGGRVEEIDTLLEDWRLSLAPDREVGDTPCLII